MARILCWGTSRARWVAAPRAPRSTSGSPNVASSRRHHDVGVADQADAAAEAVAVHRRQDRHLALVDRGERLEAAPVGAHEGVEALGGLHLLDVDAGVESPALGPQDDRPHRRVLAELPHGPGQLEPSGHGQGVDRRVVHDDLGDAGVVATRW